MSGVMKPYIVRQGDYLAKLAFVHGFDADTVWNDPKNEELQKLRPDPNILAPGDILFIPDKGEEPLAIQKGLENSYAAEVPKVRICISFRSEEGQPLANEPYEIMGQAGDGTESAEEGTTKPDGTMQFDIAVAVREVGVYFPVLHRTFRILIGEMDPIAEASGIRKRLRHLGFGDDRLRDDVEDARTLSEALAGFQRSQGLSPTGNISPDTLDALLKEHGI